MPGAPVQVFPPWSFVHGLPSSIVGAVPGEQAPAPLHRATPLQASPSLSQLTPAATGRCTGPFAGSQASDVQGLPSSMVGGSPTAQTALELQLPAPSQTVELVSQALPTGRGVQAGAPLTQTSSVQGLPSGCAVQVGEAGPNVK